ncbi:transcriptional repressor NrdR [Candidatus Sumerlaeota bacterium]|nr:transcriptional repressor NrdR [Candidatus Sumerlaeota bacterium]MBI3736425.1 transcriptional repressor NrdR [Candidatus Sumerlaeota bacterium]
MKCPFCGSLDNHVINSRLTSDETSIRRRRECDKCNERFTTFEYVEKTPLFVVKRDGSRQAFDREKIINGLLRACEKRPVSLEKIQSIVAEIEKELQGEIEKEVSSLRIGEMILNRLRGLDEVAYVRFASVYRQFRDVGEFSEEVQGLLRKEQNGKPETETRPEGGQNIEPAPSASQ